MALASAAPPGFDPKKADNFEDVCPRTFRIYTRLTSTQMEKQFAVKAVQHMMTYWSILEKMPGSKLRLTRMDDDILAHLHADFPEFDPAATIDEDEMKSPANKERWRKFMMVYEKGEKKVDDFNFGTMLRKSPKTEYGEKETMFALRMQFYAAEIARNRTGLNDWIYEQAQEAVDKEKEKNQS